MTDTEWMAHNLEYACEIVRFARRSATEDGHTELIEWATKLEHAMTVSVAPHLLVRRPSPDLGTVGSGVLASLATHVDDGAVDADTPRYVRGLR